MIASLKTLGCANVAPSGFYDRPFLRDWLCWVAMVVVVGDVIYTFFVREQFVSRSALIFALVFHAVRDVIWVGVRSAPCGSSFVVVAQQHGGAQTSVSGEPSGRREQGSLDSRTARRQEVGLWLVALEVFVVGTVLAALDLPALPPVAGAVAGTLLVLTLLQARDESVSFWRIIARSFGWGSRRRCDTGVEADGRPERSMSMTSRSTGAPRRPWGALSSVARFLSYLPAASHLVPVFIAYADTAASLASDEFDGLNNLGLLILALPWAVLVSFLPVYENQLFSLVLLLCGALNAFLLHRLVLFLVKRTGAGLRRC